MPDAALTALIDRVRAARTDRTPLHIHGGRTKAFYGEPVPDHGPAQALDIRGLCGISSYEPSELVVTVRAGTPLAELEAALAEAGQCLPFEPPRYRAADAPGGVVGGVVGGMVGGTVGGMVSASLAGPARAAVGGVRDYVLGATLLNGRAEVLSFGGQVIKNVAGYDVSRLLVGALGTLGVVCEVSLKVLPLPVASATLRLEIDEAAALKQLNVWGGQPLPINASAWWNGRLVLRLCGAAAAVQSALQSMAARLGGQVMDPALAAVFWTGLRDHSDEFFTRAATAVQAGATLWRISVPQTATPMALAGEHLVEWGGAQRWVITTTAAGAVREAAVRAGGHATIFRCGAAAAAAAGVSRLAPLSAPLLRIHQQMKAEFDPDRVFNPGRLYAGL